MDESFKARVEKVFGSLASSSSSVWSISDGKVERREWRRCADTSGRDETPCFSSFDEFFKKDCRQRDFEEDLAEDSQRFNDDAGQDEWGIRSSIGLDRTLDYEEEEDEYDKVAAGRENAGDRLYMSDVTQKGYFLNSNSVLGNKKDLRANHLAAKNRLKEDEAEAEKFAEIKEPADAKGSKDEARPKPILKRKDNDVVFKSQKRVRFDVECKNDCEEISPNEAVFKPSTGLPDYFVNPSKYTCYSLESASEVDRVSNTQACGEFLDEVENMDGETGPDVENDFATKLPKFVTFIPKKKVIDAKVVNDSNQVEQNKEGEGWPFLRQKGFPVGIAAEEVQGEAHQVEEDEPETKMDADRGGGTGFQKPSRRYRTMSNSNDSDT